MRVETIELRDYDGRRETVTVEYVRTHHWNTTREDARAYDVLIKGRKVGTVESATQSTDRIYGRIRVPGKGRRAWQWFGPNPGDSAHLDGVRASRPGSYARTRSNAVAELLGYAWAVKP